MNNIKYMLSIFMAFICVSVYAQKSEVRDLPTFTEVGLSTAAKVHITQGSPQKVELRGSEDVLEEIETEVRGEKLIIKHEGSGWFNWSDDDDLEVYITMANIEGLSVSSSGKIYGENKFKTGNVDLSVSGSGKIEASLDAEDMDLSISGSGKIELDGTASNIEASISGSGNVDAEDLRARAFKVHISGSGSCKIYAEESIDARVSGSGSVYYKGDPKNVNSSTSGSGRIKKM